MVGALCGNGESFKQTDFLIDTNNLTGYSQTFLEIDHGTGNIDKRYEYGDDLYAQISSGEAQYFLYDGLGSTRSLTDHDGNILQSYNYRPFGEGIDLPSSLSTNHLFTGEYLDPALDYYYLRARYYSPSTGRFTGYDPADDPENRLHKYAYCGNEPISAYDFSGSYFTKIDILAALFIVSILADLCYTYHDAKMLGKAIIENDPEDAFYYSVNLGIDVLFLMFDVVTLGGGGAFRLSVTASKRSAAMAISKTLITKETLVKLADPQLARIFLRLAMLATAGGGNPTPASQGGSDSSKYGDSPEDIINNIPDGEHMTLDESTCLIDYFKKKVGGKWYEQNGMWWNEGREWAINLKDWYGGHGQGPHWAIHKYRIGIDPLAPSRGPIPHLVAKKHVYLK